MTYRVILAACRTLTSAIERSCDLRCFVTHRVTRHGPDPLTSAMKHSSGTVASMIYRIILGRLSTLTSAIERSY
jgi:hypothetical protein